MNASVENRARIAVILRYDDFSALSDSDVEATLLDTLRASGLRAVFGVVPFAVPFGSADHLEARALEGSKALLLRGAVEEGLVEAALHGCTHLYLPRFFPGGGFTEFEGLTRGEQSRLLARGRKALEEITGRKARTFIPPFNSYDALTVKALQDNEFECLSAAMFDPVPQGAALRVTPHTCSLPQVREAVELARRGTSHAPVVAALFHQYDFTGGDGGPASITLAKFEKLAGWLAEQPDVSVLTASQLMDSGADLGVERHQANRRLRRFSIHPLTPACACSGATRLYLPDEAESLACLKRGAIFAALAYCLAVAAGFSAGMLAVTAVRIPWPVAAAGFAGLNVAWLTYLSVRKGRVYSKAARVSAFLAAGLAGGLAA